MKKQSKIKKVLTNKGFYVLLGLTVALLGVVGYVGNMFKTDEKLKQLAQKPPEVNYHTAVPRATPLPIKTPVPTPETDVAPTTITNASGDDAVTTGAKPVKNQVPQIILPVEGELLQKYSGDELVYNKTMKDWRVHKSLDIKGDIGTKVKAVDDGEIVSVTNDSLFGTVVTIDHKNGYFSVYASLQEDAIVKKGQVVKQGDTIGGVGVTAECEISLPPHIHFELIKDKTKVDPFEYMKEKNNEDIE